jgi:thiosulfate/3-mercaptopyruvate sulfurtransferase
VTEKKSTEFGPIVDVDWLLAHLGEPGLKIVDARSGGHYQMSHIPGAISLDPSMVQLPDSSEASQARFLQAAQIVLQRAGIHSGDRVVFYEDFSGTASARGVWLLDAVGLGNGAMLDGGLRAWLQSGETLTTARPEVEPSQLTLAIDHGVLATAGEIIEALQERAPVTMLDTRADQEFYGGTIPGSVHLEWMRVLNPDGTFKPLDELRALYAAAGIGGQTVVTYCAGGFRAANSYVILKALGIPVKNYAPSWGEWSRLRDAPIDFPGR